MQESPPTTFRTTIHVRTFPFCISGLRVPFRAPQVPDLFHLQNTSPEGVFRRHRNLADTEQKPHTKWVHLDSFEQGQGSFGNLQTT